MARTSIGVRSSTGCLISPHGSARTTRRSFSLPGTAFRSAAPIIFCRRIFLHRARAEEGRLAEQAIAETTLIEQITAAGARVAVVVLDACRDNPLQAADRRSVGGTRGLAQSQPARGVFAIYSAGFGQTALDRLGPDDRNPNSVFTRAFVEKLKTPGLDLRAVATQTRALVVEMAKKIGHDQFPAYYDQVIGGDVYLAGIPERGQESASRPVTPPAPPADPGAAERAEFAVARQIGTRAAYDAFLRKYRSGLYADLARAERDRLAALETRPASPAAPPPASGASTASVSSAPKASAPGIDAANPPNLTNNRPEDRAKKQVAVAPSGDVQPTLLARYGQWGAYSVSLGGQKNCFALAKPIAAKTEPASRTRDQPSIFVSSRPAENIKNEVSITIGYPFKTGADATAEIGSDKFAMWTKNDSAWIEKPAEEARLVEAMRNGTDLVVKGTSDRGMQSTDRYSLKGLAQALDKIKQECK
jgi:Caspase domain